MVEVKPIHIVAAGIFAFCAIVAANMLTQYQSNSEFRDRLSNIDPRKMKLVRTQLIAEENMQSVPDDGDTEEE